MNVQQLLVADLLLVVLSAAGWIGAGVTGAMGRGRLSRALVGSAAALTLARTGVVAVLAGHGWWFVQEKVVLAVPLVVAALAVSRGSVRFFAAGYASAAGLAIGYPVEASDALIAVAVVGIAGLVTWRVVRPEPDGRFLVRGLAIAAVLGLIGVGVAFVPPARVDAGGGPVRTDTHLRSVAELRGPQAPAAGGAVRRYDLAARQATVTLASGRQVNAWTYNGQVPGPALTATEGDLVEVRLTNVDITDGVTLHWHGYDVANAEDGAPGVTQDAVLPGQEHVYRFLADQVGTYWYHTHQVSNIGVRMGLFGTLIVTPRSLVAGVELAVPVHTLDGTVVIGLNDGVEAREVAAGAPVRLRLINTDSTPHRFTLAGTGFRLVAVDGNDLNEPGEVRDVALRLAAGGRYDVAFTMPSGPVALLIDDDPAIGVRFGPDGRSLTPSTAAWPSTTAWPELELTSYGRPRETPFTGRFDRDFTLVLDRGLALVDGVPAYAHTINGFAHPRVPAQHVRLGDAVRFTVVNRGMETHPWHLHGHRVLVLAKDGRAVSGSPLWMDSFDVRPGEVWQVALRADNPGVWMNHCHNLSHADQGMVSHLSYEGVSTSAHGDH